MSQPYSAQADVMNQVLTALLTQSGWNLASALPASPSDVDLRIQEGDAEIDSRLSGLGYSLPFSTTPPLLKSLSVLYARYACFRDLYAGGSPSAGTEAIKNFKDEFEQRFTKLEGGWTSLLDSSGNVIAPVANSKFGVQVAKNNAPINNPPGQLISSYMSDVDVNDGLNPSDSGSGDDTNHPNNTR